MFDTTLPAAEARRWLPSPAPRPAGSVERRPSGELADPTADTALDGRRLALSAAYERAVWSAGALVDASRALADAIAHYDGEEPTP